MNTGGQEDPERHQLKLVLRRKSARMLKDIPGFDYRKVLMQNKLLDKSLKLDPNGIGLKIQSQANKSGSDKEMDFSEFCCEKATRFNIPNFEAKEVHHMPAKKIAEDFYEMSFVKDDPWAEHFVNEMSDLGFSSSESVSDRQHSSSSSSDSSEEERLRLYHRMRPREAAFL